MLTLGVTFYADISMHGHLANLCYACHPKEFWRVRVYLTHGMASTPFYINGHGQTSVDIKDFKMLHSVQSKQVQSYCMIPDSNMTRMCQ